MNRDWYIYLCQTNTDRLCNYKFIKLYLFLTSGKYGHINECLGNFVFRLNSWYTKLNQLEFFALQNLAFHTVVLEDLKANCQDIKKILSSCFFFKSKALILWRWLLCRISLRLIGLWKYPGDHTIKRLEFFFVYLLELNIQRLWKWWFLTHFTSQTVILIQCMQNFQILEEFKTRFVLKI